MIKVLAIDDDCSMTELLTTMLRSSGFEVMSANEGAEGLQAAEAEAPDIVLLDLRMPGADGWSICRKLRDFSRVPIIILSAVDSPQSVTSALDAGADDYLVKPVPTAILIAHINNLTRQAVARRDSRPIGRQTASLRAQGHLVAGT